jgi:hypothetical protein
MSWCYDEFQGFAQEDPKRQPLLYSQVIATPLTERAMT